MLKIAKRWLPWFMKLLVSGLLTAYVLGSVDLQIVWMRAQSIPLLYVSIATALLVVQVLLWALRWHLVINALGGKLPLPQAVPITFTGLFFNQFLPASIGADIVRMWQSRRSGLPVVTAVNAVLLERYGNLFAVSLLAAVASGYWAAYPAFRHAVWIFPALALAALAGVAALIALERLPRQWLERPYVRGLAHISKDTRRVFLHFRHIAALVILAIMGQVALNFSVFAIADGLGMKLSLVQAFALMPPIVIISALPISVAGWGVRELAMVTALGALGVSAESALLLSVVMGLLVVLVSLPGSVAWLLARAAPIDRRG